MLMSSLSDVNELILRNQQAIRRTPIVRGVLEPAIERLIQLKQSILIAHAELNAAWKAGQEANWHDRDAG